jgi:hypothetical protein
MRATTAHSSWDVNRQGAAALCRRALAQRSILTNDSEARERSR